MGHVGGGCGTVTVTRQRGVNPLYCLVIPWVTMTHGTRNVKIVGMTQESQIKIGAGSAEDV